ncbi:MAG: superoxide dismutase, partial [Dactylosporangium sp.]|nr:superoxide dismutase [Dactylosporangium sp.]
MRRRQILTGLSAAAVAAVVTPEPASAAGGVFPTTIRLPDGWLPEGITIGTAPFAYFGSRADGSIYRANLVTGTGRVIARGLGEGFPSIGLKIDHHNRLFVAGGDAGTARVVHAGSGRLLATYTFTTEPAFINDVVLTPYGPYFTNSMEAALYHLPLGPGGRLPAQSQVRRIPLGGDWAQAPGFNANGIVRTPDGAGLLVVQSATGLLYRVDPASGVAERVDLGGFPLTNGDGLLLERDTLYAVLNQLNTV